MIIVTHDYSIIHHPEMTDNFIIRNDKVKGVCDITEHKVAISFISSYDKFGYEITLEKGSTILLAKDILDMIKSDSDATIVGSVKIK
jgi:hypothetical protein